MSIWKLFKSCMKLFFSKEAAVDLNIPEMEALRAILKSTKIALQEKSRAASLWLQYIEYIETCRNFIRASIGSCIYMPSVK